MQDKKIQYFDSMAGGGLDFLKALQRYVAEESMDKRKITIDTSDWQLQTCIRSSTPQQENGSDCGMFSIMFADFLTDNLPLDFHQADIPDFRIKVCASILNGKLWYA
jgi:sentrin-specific protease 1